MTNFKKQMIAGAIAVTVALSASSAFAFGGGNKGGERDQSQRFEYIFNHLELSEEQQSEVLAIMEAVAEEQREVMWDAKKEFQNSEDRPNREEMQERMAVHKEALAQSLTDEFNMVLSPELTEELVEYIQAHSSHKGGNRGGRQGGKGGDQDND